MTKQELLDALALKFHIVLTEQLRETEGGVNFYIIGVFDQNLTNETVTRKNVGFFVEDEGGPGEAAFWNKAEPKLPVPPPPAFTTAVLDFVEAEVAARRFLSASLKEVDLRNETAIGDVYLPTTPPEAVNGVFQRKPDRTIEFVETGKLVASTRTVK